MADNMIKCVHKVTGVTAMKPSSLFKDKGIAERLDWKPLEGKVFEEQPSVNQQALDVREEAKKKEFELAEKKRLWELENQKPEIKEPELTQPELLEAELTDPLADKRHYTAIIKDINESEEVPFIAQYLEDARKSVRESAEKRMEELTLKK